MVAGKDLWEEGHAGVVGYFGKGGNFEEHPACIQAFQFKFWEILIQEVIHDEAVVYSEW